MLPDSEIFIDAVDTIDCAIYHRQLGVIGVSWHIDVSARGPVTGDSFFVHDFNELKKITRSYLRDNLDHRLLLPTTVFFDGQRWLLPATNGDWSYSCPDSAVSQLPIPAINPINLAKHLTDVIQKHFVAQIKITVRTLEDREGYRFNYTHGLPGYAGNCQRLLHGHCGLVKVASRSKLAMAIPKYVHFANSEHVIANDDEQMTVAYTSQEGRFVATIPRQRVAVLPAQQASIEMISHYLNDCLERVVGNRIPITCYEGAGKGARSR